MLRSSAIRLSFVPLILACACWPAAPARAQLTLHCNWGVGALAPTVWPGSTQVMMVPTVMDVGGLPLGTSKVIFVSFGNASQINRDGAGVLRIVDLNCHEIARFPDPSFAPPIPPFCPANLNTMPHLAPASGLAVGNIDATPDVEIVGVLDGATAQHSQIIAFNLVGTHLVPKWCSAPLTGGDFIAGPSAPAIAHLDKPSTSGMSIVVDNKVYSSTGVLRYTGFSFGSNCTSSGSPCPRSRTAVVANLPGLGPRPQVITGRGLYRSLTPILWTGTLGWLNTNVSNLSPSLAYPAVGDVDPNNPGPEIVVTDTMTTTLRVLSATGTQLASAAIPNTTGSPGCGGPPMIGDADGVPGPEIGVASCNRYTLFKFSGGTLTQVWSMPTNDPGGQTTSALVNTPTGARIYYTDAATLWVFFGPNGTVLQSAPNSSNTAIEGPVIAAFDAGVAPGFVIVGANNYHLSSGGQRGLRIFSDPAIGPARAFWNQHTYHATNVSNSVGLIPLSELPSWVSPARNTYRAQQWP